MEQEQDEYVDMRHQEKRQTRNEEFSLLRPSGICDPSMDLGFY